MFDGIALRAMRLSMKLSAKRFACELGFNYDRSGERYIQRWESGETRIPEDMQVKLEAMKKRPVTITVEVPYEYVGRIQATAAQLLEITAKVG